MQSIDYSSLITHYSSPITHHPSPITHYSSPITHHSSPITHHSSLTTHHPLLITHHPSLITHHSSLTTHHPTLQVPAVPVALARINSNPTKTALASYLEEEEEEAVEAIEAVENLLTQDELDGRHEEEGGWNTNHTNHTNHTTNHTAGALSSPAPKKTPSKARGKHSARKTPSRTPQRKGTGTPQRKLSPGLDYGAETPGGNSIAGTVYTYKGAGSTPQRMPSVASMGVPGLISPATLASRAAASPGGFSFNGSVSGLHSIGGLVSPAAPKLSRPLSPAKLPNKLTPGSEAKSPAKSSLRKGGRIGSGISKLTRFGSSSSLKSTAEGHESIAMQATRWLEEDDSVAGDDDTQESSSATKPKSTKRVPSLGLAGMAAAAGTGGEAMGEGEESNSRAQRAIAAALHIKTGAAPSPNRALTATKHVTSLRSLASLVIKVTGGSKGNTTSNSTAGASNSAAGEGEGENEGEGEGDEVPGTPLTARLVSALVHASGPPSSFEIEAATRVAAQTAEARARSEAAQKLDREKAEWAQRELELAEGKQNAHKRAEQAEERALAVVEQLKELTAARSALEARLSEANLEKEAEVRHHSSTHSPSLTFAHLHSPSLAFAHLHSPLLAFTHLHSPSLTFTHRHR